VSESTVVRFASALGYGGYPEMQRDLQEVVWAQLTARERLELTRPVDGAGTQLDQVLRTDIENLRGTLREVSREAFERAVEALHAARSVYIAGFRSAAAIAQYLAFYLVFLRERVYRLTDAGATFEQLVNLGPEDLVVAISFPRYSRLTVDIVQHARERGALTLALTDSVLAPPGGHHPGGPQPDDLLRGLAGRPPERGRSAAHSPGAQGPAALPADPGRAGAALVPLPHLHPRRVIGTLGRRALPPPDGVGRGGQRPGSTGSRSTRRRAPTRSTGR
jgi:hypothetical protein